MTKPEDKTSSDRRSGNGFLPFIMGVGVMGLIGGGWYFLTQKPTNNPVIFNPTPVAPTAVSPASINPQPIVANPNPTISAIQTGSLPAPQTLNLQINHPNGSTARLTQINFAEDNLTATLTVTNGYRSEIRLNSSDSMVIQDNLGNSYNLAAPANNERIRIAPGTTLKGQFVFKGRIAPDVTSLNLITNSELSGDSKYSSTPKFMFTIPLSGSEQ